MIKPVVYDTAILVAADRNDRQRWAEHRVLLESGVVPAVPAAVVAQASRSPRQAQLRRFLKGCEVVSLDEASAHRTGGLLGKARASDVVDACVVELAMRMRARIMTGDPRDIGRLVAASGLALEIEAV